MSSVRYSCDGGNNSLDLVNVFDIEDVRLLVNLHIELSSVLSFPFLSLSHRTRPPRPLDRRIFILDPDLDDAEHPNVEAGDNDPGGSVDNQAGQEFGCTAFPIYPVSCGQGERWLIGADEAIEEDTGQRMVGLHDDVWALTL